MTTSPDQAGIFPARMDALPAAVAFVAEICGAAGLGREDTLRLTLLVEELFANTVTHGHGGDSEAPVRLGFAITPGRIALTYEDTAPPHDPRTAACPAEPVGGAEERPVGGLGLRLVQSLASELCYVRDGERNRISLVLPVSGGGRGPG
ncbi:MAG: ATP-binding protein [Candidatus Rokubacteria bacterium]|nr:ATP-binding protein [Candidatus Rokubacteria bacterium]